MDGPPIRHGSVLIGSDGRIEAIGRQGQVPQPADVEYSLWPGAVILPGLVNTHTHLELTGFAGQAEEADFPAWIRRIRALKAERTPADFLAAARAGLADCFAAGVTTVADTGDSGAVIEALAEVGGSGIAYHEVFGPHPDQLAGEHGGASPAGGGAPPVRVGAGAAGRLAPRPLHGERPAVRRGRGIRGAGGAAARGAPGGIGGGVGADGRGVGPLRGGVDAPGHSAAGAARQVSRRVARRARRPRRADPGHPRRPGRCGRRVTPRGHPHLRGALPPLQPAARARRGAPRAPSSRRGSGWGSGTDSVASVGRLDLLAEARAARALAGLSAEEALRLVTSGAARALGLEGEVGTLRPGLWGDIAVVEIDRTDDADAALEAALASSHTDLKETTIGGRVVYRR